jgi:hypothetical protein
MADPADQRLGAHVALYVALGNVLTPAPTAPATLPAGSLAALDAHLAAHGWRWEPSPTAFASWDEYAAAHEVWRQRLACGQVAE